MASAISRGQVIFQDENAQVHGKKAVDVGKTRSSTVAPKKNVTGLGSRKALNDITNKSKFQPQPQPQASSKKKIIEEDFDISTEGFLHDHSKCIEEQQYQWDNYFSDLILYGQDSINKEEITECNPKPMNDKDNHTWDEPEEIPMDEFSDWLKCSTAWCSPPCSPIYYETSPSSPLSCCFEAIEFKLKEDNGAI